MSENDPYEEEARPRPADALPFSPKSAGDDRRTEPSGERSPSPGDPDLEIIRDFADQMDLVSRPTWRPPPRPIPPPPPEPPPAPRPPELVLDAPSPASAPEPPAAEPLIAVDWDEELRPDRSPRRGSRSVARPPDPPVAPPPRAPTPRPSPLRALRVATIGGGAVFAVASVLSALRVEPFSTWYYLFAWYPFLLAINYGAARAAPALSVLARPARGTLLLFLWSVPAWLFFEIWNFRLQDWYYVGVPAGLVARRIGVVASFATVLPGIFFLEEWLGARRVFAGLRTPAFPLSPRLAKVLLGVGAFSVPSLLVFPTVFFPLLWGVPVFFLEPWLWRGGGPSLTRDLSEGRPGRVLRLLVAGLGCGLFWEAANFFAGGKWIYTVPGLETRLFEMPLAGFVGFAPFALSCWVMARALVRLGLLPDWEVRSPRQSSVATGAGELSPGARRTAGACAVAASALALWLLDWLTVDSTVPRPEDIPNIPDGVVEYAREHGRHDVHGILAMAEAGEFYVPGESSAHAIELFEDQARLVLMRGLGTANARRLDRVGVRSIEELAAQDPASLVRALREIDERGWWPRERRVAVWIAAARRAAAAAGE